MNIDWSCVIKPSGTLVSPEEIRQFEAGLGLDLPDDYRCFLEEFNGGRVIVEHYIRLPGVPFNLGVDSFWKLTAPSPFMGVAEARDLQVRNRWCLRQALAIGGDGGTGHYFILLAGERRGAVFFIWLDDRPLLSLSDWETWEVKIPEDMIEISRSFDDLRRLILDNRRKVATNEVKNSRQSQEH
jgi:hypothetical protein